jgi:predicted Rossmann fold flavoprotein
LQIYDNAIIGAGASALMLASRLKNKKNSIILESQSKIGSKILISGGGRCNFTNKNVSHSDYLGDKEFFNAIYKSYNNRWVLDFFKSRGLQTDIKNNTEYFCKNSAKELLDILKKEIKPIKIALNSAVLDIAKENNIFKISTSKGKIFAKRVIVASGGLSFAKIGASDIGFKIAKKFNHQITPTAPALVGFTLQKEQAFFKELSGISLDVKVQVENKEFSSKLLFAHKGISGPAILNASLFWSKGKISIDFLPNFDLATLKNSKKELITTLPMPKRAAKLFLEHLQIKNRAISKLTQSDILKLKELKNYSFAPAGTFGFSKAEVTKGGVSCQEIDSNSLMSKKIDNLFFLGEVLDITGRLGGFNFQWAFSSGAKCADFINQYH